jgi:hypothetical protein
MLIQERIWEYRFLYLDLNDLPSENRELETHFLPIIDNNTRTVKTMLASVTLHRAMRSSPCNACTCKRWSMPIPVGKWGMDLRPSSSPSLSR